MATLLSFFTAIRQLWGEGQHQAEIDDIMKEKATMKNTKILSVLELVKEPAFRWQLYMIVILTATIQLCGINAVECISSLKSQEITAHRSFLHFYQASQTKPCCLLALLEDSSSHKAQLGSLCHPSAQPWCLLELPASAVRLREQPPLGAIAELQSSLSQMSPLSTGNSCSFM